MKKFKLVSIVIAYTVILSMVAPSIMPAFCNVMTVEAATKVKISNKKVSLYVGKTCKLTVTGTKKTIKWSSSDTSVATVSKKGKVTAKKAGTTTITAKVNNKEYTCKVTVTIKSSNTSANTQTTVYGKVTAISGSKVTLSLGTLNSPPSGSQPSGAPDNQQNSSQPSGAPSNQQNSSQSSVTPAAQPSGTPSSDNSNSAQTTTTPGAQNGSSSGQQSGGPDLLTLTGESVTINISDTSILSKQTMQAPSGQSSSDSQKNSSTTSTTTTATNSSATQSDSSSSTASLSDISVGSILKVTYTTSVDNLVSVMIIGAGGPQNGGSQTGGSQNGNSQTGGSTGGSTSVSTGSGAYNLTEGEALSGGTYTSTNADENAIRADGVTASLNNVTVTKTAGAASSNDGSSFYGLDAAILALGKATLNITGGSVAASAEGSNGVFAYGLATINIKNTKIDVTGGNSGGIEVAGGGTMNATNLTVNSSNKAAIRSDRGGGTMTVNGGTYTTTGSSGAPAIYSTAAITANDATLTANDSEAVVVEGLNSVTLNNCNVTGNMSGTYGSNSSENIHNVMLYQSMSGDAEVGNSSFTMTDGTLTSKNGDMFYVTNTDCVIKLSNVKLNLADNTNLLVVAGNDGTRGWGTAGSNGGKCTFEVSKQTLAGNITVDKISKLTMKISDSSTFTGSINSDKTTASSCSVTLDSTSTWKLTADSYVTEFNGSMSNVNTNGHTLYVNGVAQN